MREARGPEWTDWLAEHGIVAPDRHRHALARPPPARRRARCAPPPSRTTLAEDEALDAVRARPSMEGAALVAQVSTPEPYVYCDAGSLRVAVVDYGCKRSILRRLAGAGAHVTVFPHTVDADELAALRRASSSRTAPATPSRSRDEVAGRARAARPRADPRHLPRPPAARPRDRPRDVQAPVRPPRRQPSGARADDRPRARDEPEPRLRGRALATTPRRRTSRSTTAPSRASTSRSCARARCSSTPRPARGRTTPGRSLERWLEEVRDAA